MKKIPENQEKILMDLVDYKNDGNGVFDYGVLLSEGEYRRFFLKGCLHAHGSTIYSMLKYGFIEEFQIECPEVARKQSPVIGNKITTEGESYVEARRATL